MSDPDLETLKRAAERSAKAAADLSYHYAEGAAFYAGQAATERARAELPRLRARIDAMEQAGKAERQKIGIARRQLAIADEAHAEVVRRVTGGRSASTTDCTATERAAILAEYQSKGFRPTKPRRAGRAPSTQALDRQGMLRKVEAMLTTQRLPWGYAEAILRQQRGIRDKAIACPAGAATDAELRALIAALYRREQRQRGAACSPTN